MNSKQFDGIECDVHFTKDNVAVLNHDPTVVFDDGTKLEIKSSNYSQLIDYKLFGQQICTFRRYLEICKQYDSIAVIELKSAMDEIQINILTQEIDLTYSRENCKFISFNKQNLTLAKDKNIQLFLLFSKNAEKNIDFCIKNKININVSYHILSKQMVSVAHNSNLQIGAWTVNSYYGIIKCKYLGVDYITSDVYMK